MNGYDCHLDCSDWENVNVNRLGEHSLTDKSINNVLKIECNQKYSCYNINIRCPLFGEEPCEILSTETVSIANRIDICTANNRMHVNNLSNLPIVTVIGMNCDVHWSSNCEMIVNNINKNESNCHDKISQCRVDYNTTLDLIR